MANNRLLLYDTKTDEMFCIAKSWGGWETRFKIEDLNDWLSKRDDFTASVSHGKTNIVLITEDDLDDDDKWNPPKN